MKRTVRMIGENYDIVLKEGKKVVTEIAYAKSGTELKTTRSWQSFDWLVNWYTGYGFIIEK